MGRCGRLAGLLLAVLCAVLAAPVRADPGERGVYVASDGDWPAFLEAVPAALRYDEWDRPRFHPFLAIPDLTPYPVRIETWVREGKLVFRAEGRTVGGIPEPQELVAELRQKICLPTLTESVVLTSSEGLDLASVALARIGQDGELAVGEGFRLEHPAAGEWQVVLRAGLAQAGEGSAGRGSSGNPAARDGVVRLAFEVRGHDLEVVERFAKAYRADRFLLAGTLPAAVRERLARTCPVEDLPVPRPVAPDLPVVVSTSYRSALVGAHVAGLLGAVHLVHRGEVAATAARIAATGAGRVIVLTDPGGEGVDGLLAALSDRDALKGVAVERRAWPEAEADACRRHYLGNAVVANPDDLGFPSTASYPRSSLAAPIYALTRRTGMVFVSGGDLRRYEETRLLRNVNYGLNGYQYGFAWEDVLRTRNQIAAEVARLDLGGQPALALLGGGHNVPCTFFIAGAWPKEEFPKIRFDEGAVIHADASVYANLDDDPAMEACVGRLTGNTDEITAQVARAVFREELEDREKVRANRALLVFGPWAAERDAPGEESFEEQTVRELEAAGGYACTSFTGSAWGRDFLEHIGRSRLLFANDFGYHNAGFGWSSYAHPGFRGPETNYNTQVLPLSFDASYCVASSNGCATCDDKNRGNLHYGGNSLPAGLLFFRNGALAFFGMPNAALAEITTPLVALSTGMTFGEAIRKHLNDRIANPEQGGLYGGPQGWRSEVPGYDALPQTHPLLYPLTKQDALVLFGDPLARLDPPPAGSYLDLARGAGDFLVAGAKETLGGLDLTGEPAAEAAYGQSTAGAAIFLARLSEATGEPRYLEAARRAADFVAAATERDDDRVPGLFTGDDGKGLLYLELFRLTKDAKHFERADAIARTFAQGWTYAKNGQPYWTTDLYAGAAGHVLFLLEMHRAKPDAFYLDEARRAGDFLLAKADAAGDGALWWAMEPWGPSKDVHYTGVAHGAAGIAIALAALGQATKDARYTAAAEAAAKGVMDRAIPQGAGVQWFAKYTPEAAQVKYQWCHGPPGMLLMFLRLHAATGKELYREWAARSAITAAKPGKFYRDDMSLCHGPPGNGDVFLEAYEILGDERYLEVAKDHAEWVRRHGLVTKQGLDWWGANRSYMNGVAGVGHFLLRMAFPGRYRPALLAK